MNAFLKQKIQCTRIHKQLKLELCALANYHEYSGKWIKTDSTQPFGAIIEKPTTFVCKHSVTRVIFAWTANKTFFDGTHSDTGWYQVSYWFIIVLSPWLYSLGSNYLFLEYWMCFVAFPSSTELTRCAKRSEHRLSLLLSKVGLKLTNMRALPSPLRQSCRRYVSLELR